MRSKKSQRWLNSMGALCILALILSTLLIFIIKLWIVLIINACGIIFFRIVFRKMVTPAWFGITLYLVACCLSIGIMVLVMYYPDKICGGTMRHVSDDKYWIYFREYFFGVFSDSKLKDIVFTYHFDMGWLLLIQILQYAIAGIFLICNFVEDPNEDIFPVEELPFYLSLPLASLGALIIANIEQGRLVFLILCGIVYSVIMTVIQIIRESSEASYGGGNYSSGDDYDIIIIKH